MDENGSTDQAAKTCQSLLVLGCVQSSSTDAQSHQKTYRVQILGRNQNSPNVMPPQWYPNMFLTLILDLQPEPGPNYGSQAQQGGAVFWACDAGNACDATASSRRATAQGGGTLFEGLLLSIILTVALTKFSTFTAPLPML